MKKIMIILLVSLSLFITGCGNKKVDIDEVKNVITGNDNFKSNELLDKDELNYRYDIDTTYFGDTVVYYYNSLDSSNTVFVIEITDNLGLDEYDKLVDLYKASWLDNPYNVKEENKVKDALETDYNGYKIFIVSDDNESVLKAIKDSME